MSEDAKTEFREVGQIIFVLRNLGKVSAEEIAGFAGRKVAWVYRMERSDSSVELGPILEVVNRLGLKLDVKTRLAELPKDLPIEVFDQVITDKEWMRYENPPSRMPAKKSQHANEEKK